MMYWITVGGYLVFAVAMLVLGVVSARRPRSIAPLGDMLERIMVSRTARVGIIAAWWWFGWHFIFAPPVG